jgi:hypothetical protein
MAEPIRTSGGNVGFGQDVDSLTSIGPRRAGSESERRAARQLQQRLEEMGREAHVEPTRVRPDYALANLVHAVAGIVGSVLSVYVPLAGLVLTAAATVSAFGDLTGTFHLVRSLMPARASQNVVSDEDEDKPGLLVLVAHYDAPRRSLLSAPRLRAWPRWVFWSLVVVTVCSVGRLAGLSATWFTVIQFIPTVVLIASTPLFADAAIGDTSPGARDNAAGVATVLRLAQTYSGRLEHFNLMVVFTGASAEFGLGFRQWLKRRKGQLDPSATAVISVDDVGGGDTLYAEKEGAVFVSRMHPMLLELASEDGRATITREVSDAYIARASGLPALRITSESADDPDKPPDADSLARTYDFAAALIERIDAEIGPQLT